MSSNYFRIKKSMEEQLYERALNDKKFEEKLLTDPRAACEEMGWDIPEEINIEIIHSPKEKLTLVYPDSAHYLDYEEVETKLQLIIAEEQDGWRKLMIEIIRKIFRRQSL